MRASRLFRRVLFCGLIGLFLLLVAGCNVASGDDDDDSDAAPDVVTGSAADVPSSEDPAQRDPADVDSQSVATTNDGTATEAESQSQSDWNRLVVRTARLNLEVEDVGRAITWVRDTAASKGGYVFSSNSYLQEDQQFAEITIQVPVATFDDTMNALRNGELVSTVEREESTSQDVSSEFVDNESRIATLRETHARFLDLLSKATSVDEILKLEHELQGVREEIETIEGRQQYLDQATAFSTITVALTPVGLVVPAEPEPVPAPAESGFSIRNIASRAWDHSSGLLEALLVATITVAIFTAVFLPIALLSFVVYRFVRKRVRAIASSHV